MSAPTFPHSALTATTSPRALPPYAGPAPVAAAGVFAGKVGPFVPMAERERAGWRMGETMATPAVPAPIAAMVRTQVPTPVATGAVQMSVPASIPPYRPLRPTPIVTPAIRTPLYIPPVPTPAGEAVVQDEGVIEPQLVHTAEFAVPTEATAAAELPWIDSFLANTPVMAMDAVAEGVEAEVPVVDTPALEAHAELPAVLAEPMEPVVQESVVEAEVAESADAEPAAEEPSAEEWPLDEAAVEFRALRDALDAQAAKDASGDEAAGEVVATSPAPLPEWSDDDMMDIMPIRHSGKTPLSSAAIPADGELWAERARNAHDEAQLFRAMAAAGAPENAMPQSTAEEAANALELLARRVRAGELTLPSYDPRMGEPAALVAALAALLGVRLR